MVDLLAKIASELANHEELSRILDANVESHLNGSLPADEDASKLAEARGAKEAAENALAEFRFAEAAERAWAGMDKLPNVSPAAALPLYADLAFVVGQARLGEKKVADANLAFAWVHRLDKRRVDPSRYLPEVVAAYDKAQPAPATISIEVRGTGRVWIDGVAVGEGDGTHMVSPGYHVVQFSGPDREPRGFRFLAKTKEPIKEPIKIEDAPASTELKLHRARLALSRALDPADRATAMRHLAEAANVKDAVLIWIVDGRLTFQAWRDGAPGYDGPVFLRPEMYDRKKPPDQVLEALAPHKKPPKVVDKPIVIPTEPKPWYRRTWVKWSGIATFVGLFVGAIVWSQHGPGDAGVNSTIGGFDGTSSTRPR